MGPTWGTSEADRTQVSPMLAPWTLLSGQLSNWRHQLRSFKCIITNIGYNCISPSQSSQGRYWNKRTYILIKVYSYLKQMTEKMSNIYSYHPRVKHIYGFVQKRLSVYQLFSPLSCHRMNIVSHRIWAWACYKYGSIKCFYSAIHLYIYVDISS